MKEAPPRPWCSGSSTQQGVIYCEQTGKDIALTYDDEDGVRAETIRRAVNSFEALRESLEHARAWIRSAGLDRKPGGKAALKQYNEAINLYYN